jgi:hypothetical protein
MSETKHTPGPWTFNKDRYHERNIRAADGAPLVRDDYECPIWPDNDADWLLMAAAPNLLAACKLARAYLNVCLGAPTWDGENPYTALDSAISKAEGEQ